MFTYLYQRYMLKKHGSRISLSESHICIYIDVYFYAHMYDSKDRYFLAELTLFLVGLSVQCPSSTENQVLKR